jgi:small subunit ribosomal protein S10
MKRQVIKIRLRGKNLKLVDQSAERIVELAEKNGTEIATPYTAANREGYFTKTRTHRSSIDLLRPTARAVDALMRLDLRTAWTSRSNYKATVISLIA